MPNGRQQNSTKGRSHLPRCVACLYAVGWGIKRIVRHTGFAKTSVHRFARANGLTDSLISATRKATYNEQRRKPTLKEMKQAWAQEWSGVHYIGELKHWAKHPAITQGRSDAMVSYYANLERSRERGRVNARTRHARVKSTPEFKAKVFARNQLMRIKRQAIGYAKTLRAHQYLGCTYQHAAEYIEAQLPPGWGWHNHGTIWEIDHVIQLSDGSLLDQEHVRRVCHYTNLRPLEVTTNRTRPRGHWAGRQNDVAA
jgi:hypothetical protein